MMSFVLDHAPQTVTTTRAPAVLINHRQLNLTLTGLNQVRTNFGHPGSFWNTWAMCGISQILYFCFYFAVDESQILEKDIYLKSNYWIDVHLWQTVGIPIAKECLLPGAGTSNHPSSTVACYWTQTCHYHYTEVRDGVKKSRKFQDLVLNKGGGSPVQDRVLKFTIYYTCILNLVSALVLSLILAWHGRTLHDSR